MGVMIGTNGSGKVKVERSHTKERNRCMSTLVKEKHLSVNCSKFDVRIYLS